MSPAATSTGSAGGRVVVDVVDVEVVDDVEVVELVEVVEVVELVDDVDVELVELVDDEVDEVVSTSTTSWGGALGVVDSRVARRSLVEDGWAYHTPSRVVHFR
jgi:hypothetical protein